MFEMCLQLELFRFYCSIIISIGTLNGAVQKRSAEMDSKNSELVFFRFKPTVKTTQYLINSSVNKHNDWSGKFTMYLVLKYCVTFQHSSYQIQLLSFKLKWSNINITNRMSIMNIILKKTLFQKIYRQFRPYFCKPCIHSY